MTKPKNQQSPQAPAVQVTPGAKFVTVASKLPMNVELQLCRAMEARVTGQFGATTETVMVKTGAVHVIRGTAVPQGTQPKGYRAPNMLDAGYAMTPNVPADFFAEWLRQNADTHLVRNGIIKAHAQAESLEKMAREHEGILTGLEAVNPDGDPRSPKPLNPSVQGIATETRAGA